MVRCRRGDHRQAIADYSTLVKLQSNHARREAYAEAKRDLEAAVEIDPGLARLIRWGR